MKNIHDDFYPAALTIAGSDSGGGAGIQADLRTFNAAGVFGCSVITAVTAQNPRQVTGFEAVSPELVTKQLEAVFSAIAIKAVKTGMLANAAVVEAVSSFLAGKKVPLVVDPVMISTSGAKLLNEAGLQALKNKLLPLADLITPNLPEAEWLLERKLKSETDILAAAEELAEKYDCNILLKGGHAENAVKSVDVAVIGKRSYFLSSNKIDDLPEFAGHGTGCTLSSAVTAMLATNCKWKDALRNAKAYVYGSLCETAMIGKGLEAMYPPLEDYSNAVSIYPAREENSAKNGSGKDGRK